MAVVENFNTTLCHSVSIAGVGLALAGIVPNPFFVWQQKTATVIHGGPKDEVVPMSAYTPRSPLGSLPSNSSACGSEADAPACLATVATNW